MLVSSSPVLVVSADPVVGAAAREALEPRGYRVAIVVDPARTVEMLYGDPPQCLLIECPPRDSEQSGLVADLKTDHVYGHLPVILLVQQGQVEAGFDWTVTPADDYVTMPLSPADLAARVALCQIRAQRDVNANPLTGLPGNLTIMREAEERITSREPFAMAYLDIDNFRSYNECYGFARGDEVIRMTARILVNALHTAPATDAYVGHVGGDDFVFIMPPSHAAEICRRITADFDSIVPSFYDEEDRFKGCIRSVDRRGNPQTFPLMTLTIAIVDTTYTRVVHLGELSTRAAEVRRFAKQLAGSNFTIDRRR